MFWNLMFATLEYVGISDEEWQERYAEHYIVRTFVQKYPDATLVQELNFGFKRLAYIHQNGTDTMELHIVKGSDKRDFFYLYCETENNFDSIPVLTLMQLETFYCKESRQ